MLSNEELIKAQDADIKNLLQQVKELQSKLDGTSGDVILTTKDVPCRFKENYFYVASGWNYVYRCYLLAVIYNSYSKNFEPLYEITGVFYRGSGFKVEYGKRRFKKVLSWSEVVTKLDTKILKESCKGYSVSSLLEIKDFLMNNKDINLNQEYNNNYGAM